MTVDFSILLSFSPFASSPNDTAEEILAQIGSGKVVITGGNWDLVSEAAKVTPSFSLTIIKCCLCFCEGTDALVLC